MYIMEWKCFCQACKHTTLYSAYTQEVSVSIALNREVTRFVQNHSNRVRNKILAPVVDNQASDSSTKSVIWSIPTDHGVSVPLRL